MVYRWRGRRLRKRRLFVSRRLRIVLAVDPSNSASKRSNFFVIAVVGMDLYTRKLHVLDVFRERVAVENQAAKVYEYFLRWYDEGLRTIGIEAIFRQAELVRQVEKLLTGFARVIIPIHRHKDKETRLSGLAMRYASGDIVHPEGVDGRRPDWVTVLEDELCTIGWEKGIELHEFDDQADPINDACDILTGHLIQEPFVPRHHKVTIDAPREAFPIVGKG